MLAKVRQRWTTWLEGESYPMLVVVNDCPRRHRHVVVCGTSKCRWENKSVEEAKKKQKKGLTMSKGYL
jgi:hypothetical protein